ncbi:VOC family protein [Methylocella silvestris]|uniref:Bleomycin resistance protein n=1 Tax=Methylocella silvestris TaxID=199596 RepID=A0A2J7TCP9_METSI|nr:VOC family protein [Methylocella silvestris]PNG24540.1 bleomycin resistance protein [Methylocella silvestris]
MSENLHRAGRDKDALVANLHYLELGCAEVEKSAQFYERALGYAFSKHGDAWIGRGPERRLILLPGDARKLVSSGFAVARDELEHLRARIRKTGWAALNGPTRLFSDSVTVRDPDGNCYAFGMPEADEKIATANPQARMQHVVTSSPNPAAIVQFLVDILGFTVTDVVVDDQRGMRVTFMRCSNEHHSAAVFRAAESRFDHHSYEVASWNDIRDWADHMAKEHIPLQWGPGRHGPGHNLFMFVHDPDGNWIEFSADLEIVGEGRPIGEWPHAHRTLNEWGLGRLRS